MKKRIVSVILVLTLCVGMVCTLSAQSQAASTVSSLQKSAAKLRKMDSVELNEYIDGKIAEIEALEKRQAAIGRIFGNTAIGSALKASNLKTYKAALKLVWFAAAQVIRLGGCSCAAKLMECSVFGLDYTETEGGLFRDKIVQTKTFGDYLTALKNGTMLTDRAYVLAHEKSESVDLYYSLHACTYNAKKSGNQYEISVYDKYDFAYMEGDSFTALINNWAWLCQHAEVLESIDVHICFTA